MPWKVEGYKCSLSIRIVGPMQKKIGKLWLIICLNFFEKISLDPSQVSTSYFLHFEGFETWWVCEIRLNKNSLYSIGEDAMIKDFKLEILKCFNSLIIEHWIFHIFIFFYQIGQILKALGEWLQMFFELQKQRINVWDSTAFEFWSVHSLTYLS
jgi:hypothetical protein